MKEIFAKNDLTKFARLGYAARGTIYLIVGWLALLAAFGRGGDTTDSKGALLAVLNQPFGNLMMAILIIGLLGYSGWRLIQSFKDPDGHGTDIKGVTIRSALFISAVVHIALAAWAVTLLLGSSSETTSQGGNSFTQGETGQLISMIAGIAVLGAGIAHLIKGWTAKFEKYMRIPNSINTFANPVCRFGLIARGVVWCLVGWLIINSALKFRSGELSGMKEALHYVQDMSYGPLLFTIISTGLLAFGIYSVLEAVYRRVDA